MDNEELRQHLQALELHIKHQEAAEGAASLVRIGALKMVFWHRCVVGASGCGICTGSDRHGLAWAGEGTLETQLHLVSGSQTRLV